MKRADNKDLKLNNAGFSLVEIIISVMILSVVAVPILSAFVTSARINMKAKETQRVTAAAQSLVEGFKAEEVEVLVDQFNGTNAMGTPVAFTVYESTAISGKSYTPNPGSTEVGIGTYAIKGMDYEGAKYDAKITLGKYDSATGYKGHDDIITMTNMNGCKDAIYTTEINEIASMYGKISANALTYRNTKEQIYEGYTSLDPSMLTIKRSTTIKIEGSPTKQKVTVSTKYTGELHDCTYYDATGTRKKLNGAFTGNEFVVNSPIYDNNGSSDPNALLENVFLFVLPAYKNALSIYPIESDTFDIKNTSKTDVSVFFIKQKTTTLNASSLAVCEAGYAPKFTLDNGSGSSMTFYHNLDDNLAGGATVGPYNLSYLTSSTIHVGLSYTDFDKNLVYGLTVEMYEDGQYDSGFSGTPIYTMEATMNDN